MNGGAVQIIVAIATIAASIGGAAVAAYFERGRRRAEVRKLEAEIKKLEAEASLYQTQIKVLEQDKSISEPGGSEIKNFINNLATAVSSYIYHSWINWQSSVDSEPQHFISLHRKTVELMVLNLGIGYVKSGQKLYRLGDVLYCALDPKFLNETLDPLLRQLSSDDLRRELWNAYYRAFEKAIQEPEAIIRNSQDHLIRNKYGL
ncbi:MAG: hypothetical protein QXT77_09590 [Candidatus Methanomethylicaceae archaeon]